MKKMSSFGSRVLLGLFALQMTSFAQDRTPVVLFPGWQMTRLEVSVNHQTAAPGCPLSGSFEMVGPSADFPQICRDKLTTLVYKREPSLPMSQRFSEQPGVTVSIKNYGMTASAPYYEALYAFLESHGYTRDLDVRVAGYDSRLTPDLGGFLENTKALVEQTYNVNGNRPVHLVGHSNGPVYAQYLLTHTTQQWKNQYIHGFTPLAGNWPGQGMFYALMWIGLDLGAGAFPADGESARVSALMLQSHPSTYITVADPGYFKNSEVILQAGSSLYTPQDWRKLFRSSGMEPAQELGQYYFGFVRFAEPPFFPNVDVYAEIGTGLDTLVGLSLPDLTVGQLIDASTQFFVGPGDSNQEDITNHAIQVWEKMNCYRFEFTENPGVAHMDLPNNDGVLGRLWTNLQRTKSVCR
jgi:lecithin-cholesterol acyltransferase